MTAALFSAPQPDPKPQGKHRKVTEKSSRTRAREFAVQALYQHLVGKNEAAAIDAFTRDLSGFHKADSAHYDALLHGCIEQSTTLDEALTPYLDRPMVELSPIERSVLWIGAYELKHCADVPLRVVINECIELAKSFGGTDGHKYVNGVLHPLGQQWRPDEAQRDAAGRSAKGSSRGSHGATKPAPAAGNTAE